MESDEYIPIIYETNRKGKVILLNRIIEYLNLTPQKVIGKHFTDFMPFDVVPQATRDFYKTLDGNMIKSDLHIIKANGDIFYYTSVKFPRIYNNRIIGIVGIVIPRIHRVEQRVASWIHHILSERGVEEMGNPIREFEKKHKFALYCDYYIYGENGIARRLGVTPQTIFAWLKKGKAPSPLKEKRFQDALKELENQEYSSLED